MINIPMRPRGDLLVRVRVKQHPIGNPDGANLHTVLKVNVLDLITGTKTTSQTLEKRKSYIPHSKGTQTWNSIKYTRTRLTQLEEIGEEIYILQYKEMYPNINDPKILEQVQRMKNETN